MATGFDYGSTKDIDEKQKKRIKRIITTIKRIVANHGLDDSEWIKSISGRFFLLLLGRSLKYHQKHDYEKLMDRCLKDFRMTYRGKLVLDETLLQITPKETVRIMNQMEEEDKKDNYFTRFPKMAAQNINSDLLYRNFHYALLLTIVSEEKEGLFTTLQDVCLENLFSDNSLDDSDGWYPYRTPWVTARLLISINGFDYSRYEEKYNIQATVNNAIESLFKRLGNSKPIWRSGCGTWVTDYETTGICLEALYDWGRVNSPSVKTCIEFLLSEKVITKWLDVTKKFDSEENSNAILGNVVLASVIYYIIRDEAIFRELYEEYQSKLLEYFETIINIVDSGDIGQIGQFATIPEILFYILLAVK